jgi:HPt (histidine-containing phosphotransfer) domain-containing protein
MYETDSGDVALDPVAVGTLREMIGDDPEMIREIVDAFLEDAPERLAEIANGLADGDAELVRRAAHTLKANGLTFGAVAFAQACRELEDAARAEQLDAAVPIAADVERTWSAVRPELQELAVGSGS